jgi:hypothetical protein
MASEDVFSKISRRMVNMSYALYVVGVNGTLFSVIFFIDRITVKPVMNVYLEAINYNQLAFFTGVSDVPIIS